MQKLSDLLGPQCDLLLPPEKKQRLRKLMQAQRASLQAQCSPQDWGPPQFLRALQALNLTLEALAPAKEFRIAIYFPMGSELNFLSLAQPHWLLPSIGEQQGELRWFEYGDGREGYEATSWGTRQKPFAEAFTYTFDHPPLLCFVPGLCASPEGYRLGYGGGYYDRFLAHLGSHVTSILCLPSPEFLIADLPREPWDRKVSQVIF